MLIMTLETNIKITSNLSLSPVKIAYAGDRTGSPASQAGTLPKELYRQLIQ
jgi:hypothetical protein